MNTEFNVKFKLKKIMNKKIKYNNNNNNISIIILEYGLLIYKFIIYL